MDRFPRIIYSFIFLWLFLLSSYSLCIADIIIIPPPGEEITAHLAFNAAVAFFFTVVVEYIVVYLFVELTKNKAIRLLFWTILVNLITNPILQFIYYYVCLSLLVGHRLSSWQPFDTTTAFQHAAFLLIFELIAVAVEYGLFRLIFRRLHRKGFLKKPVPRLKTLIISLVANAASLLLSIIVHFNFRGIWHM